MVEIGISIDYKNVYEILFIFDKEVVVSMKDGENILLVLVCY